MGRSFHVKFKASYGPWTADRADLTLADLIVQLASEFSKRRDSTADDASRTRVSLRLTCFDDNSSQWAAIP